MLRQNFTFTLILSLISAAVALYALWKVIGLNRLRKTFFSDPRGVDLESVILALKQDLATAQHREAVLESELAAVTNQLGFAVQNVGLVRFNPFDDGGGNFSFTLALLDEHQSGMVLTSMHSRQQNRIYAKKIEKGKSETLLTEEEQKAITIANSRLFKTNTERKLTN